MSGKRKRRQNQARQDAPATTGRELEQHVRFLTQPLREIERVAQIRTAGLEMLLSDRSRLLGRGELSMMRDGLGLLIEHDRTAARQFCTETGFPDIVEQLKRELEQPGLQVIMLRLPEGETDD